MQKVAMHSQDDMANFFYPQIGTCDHQNDANASCVVQQRKKNDAGTGINADSHSSVSESAQTNQREGEINKSGKHNAHTLL